MTKRGLVCVMLAGCGTPAATMPPPPPPDDHELHTISTPEPGGTHFQIVGKGVTVKALTSATSSFLPLLGTLDINVDLHVPESDFRRATGEATAKCAANCAIGLDLPLGSDLPAPVPIEKLEARAVFAKGVADLTTWTVVAKDVHVELTGHLELAKVLTDSVATLCLRTGKPGGLVPGSRIAAILGQADIAVDANGMQNIKFRGPLSAIEPVEFGCDGQTRPPPPPEPSPAESDDASSITKLTATSFDLDRSLIPHVLDNPMQFSKGARLVPAMRDGKPHGYKVYAVRRSSLIAKLGLENGDTLLSIDGHPLVSAESALNVYTSMRDVKAGQTITVEIERNGQPVTLTYNVRR